MILALGMFARWLQTKGLVVAGDVRQVMGTKDRKGLRAVFGFMGRTFA
jgi:hypothetical protein